MIYTCKIYFHQPTTAALMECATLSESGSHIVANPAPARFPKSKSDTALVFLSFSCVCL